MQNKKPAIATKTSLSTIFLPIVTNSNNFWKVLWLKSDQTQLFASTCCFLRSIHTPLAVSKQQNFTSAVGRFHQHTAQINILYCSTPPWPAWQSPAHPAVRRCDERSEVNAQLWTGGPAAATRPDILQPFAALQEATKSAVVRPAAFLCAPGTQSDTYCSAVSLTDPPKKGGSFN